MSGYCGPELDRMMLDDVLQEYAFCCSVAVSCLECGRSVRSVQLPRRALLGAAASMAVASRGDDGRWVMHRTHSKNTRDLHWSPFLFNSVGVAKKAASPQVGPVLPKRHFRFSPREELYTQNLPRIYEAAIPPSNLGSNSEDCFSALQNPT